MKNILSKIITIYIVLILGFSQVKVFASLDDNEEIEIQQVWNEINNENSNQINKLKINSRAAVVFDRTSKTIIYEKNAYQKMAMASTTKIMTAIITLEKGNLEDMVEVGKKAANTGGSRLGLKKGDKISLKDLLYGLMLRSRK